MRINMGDLLQKAAKGTISKDEMKEVLYRINNLTDKPNIEALLAIVAETRQLEHREVLEKFLVYPENPMVSRSVLMALCEDWGMAHRYIAFIKEMMRGEASWDEDEQVRLIALSVGTDLFKQTRDKELLRIMLEVYENENVDMITRGAAYAAIARSLGVQSWELPTVGALSHHLNDSIDQNIIHSAYKMLEKD